MSEGARKFIRYALSIGALEFIPEGRRLKSDRVSPYFFNSGLFNFGEALSNLADAYAAQVVELGANVLFGPAYKGIPLVAATSIAMWDRYGMRYGYAFNRKEAKDHGEEGVLVGHPLKNNAVAILDDVITSGMSGDEACQIVNDAGGRVVGYVISFDRQERDKDSGESAVQEFQKRNRVVVSAAAKLSDLIAELKENGKDYKNGLEILPKILAYREQYGAKF